MASRGHGGPGKGRQEFWSGQIAWANRSQLLGAGEISADWEVLCSEASKASMALRDAMARFRALKAESTAAA
jgi:hypothetical protein